MHEHSLILVLKFARHPTFRTEWAAYLDWVVNVTRRAFDYGLGELIRPCHTTHFHNPEHHLLPLEILRHIATIHYAKRRLGITSSFFDDWTHGIDPSRKYTMPSSMDAEAQKGGWAWSGVKLSLTVRWPVYIVLDSPRCLV